VTPVAATTSIKVTKDRDGRLPAIVVDRPISAASFARLTEQWRDARVWLSLWNADGRLVESDAKTGRLWTALLAAEVGFTPRLAEHVRTLVKTCSGAGESPSGGQPEWGPWHPNLSFLAAPVRWRQRTVGAVIGGVVTSAAGGEEFTRLCTQCGLDREAALQWAVETGAVRPDELPGLVRLLQLSVQLSRELEVGREEISVLTSNLEDTYEELNLIYQISRQMNLDRKPGDVLQSIGRDVLEVSRAAGIAFVLREQMPASDAVLPVEGAFYDDLHARVVQVGHAAPGLRELEDLAERLDIKTAPPPSYILLNNAGEGSELNWAQGWLKHLVALPLWHEQELLGVLLAINCRDEGDYTSVDVQLLRAVADRVAAFLQNQRLYTDLAELLMGMLHALVNSIDAKDSYTCGHSERVAFYGRALARAAGATAAECDRVYLAGLLHDVGKIGVPDAVLCKPGKLTNEEFDAMRRHPEIGAKILARVRQIADLIPGVLNHHERPDGRGYPHRLAGRAIPLYGRIICLADGFDAMTSSRTYRTALPLPAAIAEIRRCSGTQFDPELAEHFLKLDLQELAKEARTCQGIATA
jgi:HD-GYP domain-containing protein (c-di-GMP phosphodiesterase class II)